MTLSAEEQLRRKYIRSLPEKMRTLQEQISQQDVLNVQSLLHKLAGSAGMYGFSSVSSLAAAMEELIIAGEPLQSTDFQAACTQLTTMVTEITN